MALKYFIFIFHIQYYYLNIIARFVICVIRLYLVGGLDKIKWNIYFLKYHIDPTIYVYLGYHF